MKKLVIVDSDGTLKKSNDKISKKLKLEVKKFILSGNYFVVSTARPRYHTLEVSKSVGASNFIISSNGTEIYDVSSGEVIYEKLLSKDVVSKAYELALFKNVRIVLVTGNKEYVTIFTKNNNQVLINEDNESLVLDMKIKQIMFVSNYESKINDLESLLVSEFKLAVNKTSNIKMGMYWLSISNELSSKGKALKFLSDYLNIENTYAIGNDYNDIPMLKEAKTSLVVDNACEEVKKFADKILESNDNDGVCKYIKFLNDDLS